MRKILIAVVAVSLLTVFASSAFAADITPNIYTKTGQSADFNNYSHSTSTGTFSGFTTSTHLYGTWNNPYTAGVEGYNYNDAQSYPLIDQGRVLFFWGQALADYTLPFPGNPTLAQMMGYTNEQVQQYFPYVIPAGMSLDTQTGQMTMNGQGPHGGYATSTHKCRDCHAVHRASGKFKLTRADSRTEACDWCHGDGAGSGYNIQTDNDDAFTKEYNVGHTMGFGTSDGKFKAPDDTYPAYTPKYYMGGFSCFDCHSPHANPQRLFGYMDMGRMLNAANIWANPSHPLSGAPAAPGNERFLVTGQKVPGFISNPGLTDYNIGFYAPWPLTDRQEAYEVDATLQFGFMGYTFNVPVKLLDWQTAKADNVSWLKWKPYGVGGRWLLLANPDDAEPVPDYSTATVTFPGDGNDYRVNKIRINWDFPYGTASEDDLLGDSSGRLFINPI